MREENVDTQSSVLQKQPGNMNVFQNFSNKLLSVLDKESIAGAVFLFAMMLLTVADVIGRYFFNRPVQGTDEITGLLLVCVAACALAYGQIRKGHIRVDMITGRLPPKGRILCDIFAYVVCLFGASVITWQTFVRTIEYMFKTQGNLTETLSIPFFPFMLVLGLGFLLLGLVTLIDLIKSLAKVVKR